MTQEPRRVRVCQDEARLDRFLADRCPDLSRSRLQELIQGGFVRVDGVLAKPSRRLRAGEVVTVVVPPPEPVALVPEETPLTIVYQDPDVLVVDKPAGLTVHPAPGHPRGTLVNALLALCPDLSGIGGELRPGIVHRLDKDTSGLMMVAKDDRAHRALAAQLKERRVVKGYLALVWGHPRPSEGVIDAPIARDPRHRKRMAVVPGGRAAVTHYRVLERRGPAALLEVSPRTGRTHQIRVHLAHRGHPLVGDRLYSRRPRLLERHFLHAHYLGFFLPSSGEFAEFTSRLPRDLEVALERLTVQGDPYPPSPLTPR